ncbi:protein asteroid homolog 1-like [Astatotilapia calliptera]|uniref:Asteroid domain-containing protein n=1 Tax=Astatotilapia calliptera TaxID=8154 RepID=A0A3P8PGY6_ASTCA|nr:protein asteroid homolog 1-like [Astatotilapia calliptera]
MEVSALKKMIDVLSLCEDVKVEKTDLIIDGNALYYFLYYTSDPKLDQRCGGDYPGFKHEVCKFFKTLQDCEVNPYVILDGGSGPEKHEKNVSRLKYKLKKAKTIAETEPDGTLPEGYNVLPPLVKDVFLEILKEEKIEFEVCLGEADPEVVSKANQEQCAVLSIDKDFYIFDVHKGFLNLHNFEWKKEEDGKIPAKIYTRSTFCEHFELDPALMPVFASIAGNDYSNLEDNDIFANKSSSPGESSIKRLDGMLCFLSEVNLDGLNDSRKRERALSKALKYVGKKENQTFKFAIERYVEPEKNKKQPSSKLPPWVCKKVEHGELTSFATSVVGQKTMMLTPLVEDFSQRSSYQAAYRIRQYFYGLLTGDKITEYDRNGENIKHYHVRPIPPSSHEQKQLKLQCLTEYLSMQDERRRVFEEALEVQTSVLENIPNQLKLPVYVTVFWFKSLQQHHCLHALLLWFVCKPDGPEDEFERKMKVLNDEGVSNWKPCVAHAFSQWQCCMRQSLHLNQLLLSPLPEPQFARLYCGPLLHRLADGDTIEEVQKTLRGEKKKLYENLKTVCNPSSGEGSSVLRVEVPSTGERSSGMSSSSEEGWEQVANNNKNQKKGKKKRATREKADK